MWPFGKTDHGKKGKSLIAGVIGQFESWKQQLKEGIEHIETHMAGNRVEMERLETEQVHLATERDHAIAVHTQLHRISGKKEGETK